MEAHMAKVAKGPYGFMVLYPNGRDPSLGKHCRSNWEPTSCAPPGRDRRIPASTRLLVRTACVTIVGLLASLMTLVPYWNWYGYPTDFTLAQIVEHTVGWLLAGLVLASIVRPPPRVRLSREAAADGHEAGHGGG